MASSGEGAALAGPSARGNRKTGVDNAQDYQVILPQLPTGPSVLNTVFLHADVRARPYKVEEFRDTLVRLEMFPEVIALGAYQMNHLWAVTFKDAEGAKRLAAAGELLVKGRRCLVIDPRHQDIRLKLHWVLHNVSDDEVRSALGLYGRVTEVTRDRWRVPGCSAQLSTTRLVTLQLKSGVSVDDIPHQVRVAGEQALVVVPGRAPQCLRCHRSGHIRRECRVPRCALCRRFGHDESECVRTYANVAGPGGDDKTSDFVMDTEEAEEAARGKEEVPAKEVTPPEPALVEPPEYNPPAEPVKGHESAPQQDDVTEADNASKCVGDLNESDMNVDAQSEDVTPGASAVSGKRARESGGDEGGGDGKPIPGEPPVKAVLHSRRPGLKNKPPDKNKVK